MFPMTAIVVVDDTAVGIEAGLNAGAWTVAVTKTGNALGLSEREVAQLDKAELAAKLTAAAADFQRRARTLSSRASPIFSPCSTASTALAQTQQSCYRESSEG